MVAAGPAHVAAHAAGVAWDRCPICPLDACADGVVPGPRAGLVLQRFDRDYACLPVCDGRSARLPTAFLVDVLSQ